MPQLRHSCVPARAGLAAVVAVSVTLALTGCSSSAPAQLAPTAGAELGTPEPSADETLLDPHETGASTVGGLAPGFPGDLVPVPPGAEVLVSSAIPVAGTDLVEISLNVRTDQDTAGLMDAVRGPLTSAGFAEDAPAAAEPGLAAQATFSRSGGAELLVAGVLDRDDTRTLTVGGRVHAAVP